MGIFWGFLIHYECSESIWATVFKVFADCYREWGTRLGTVRELGYLKRIENWRGLVIWFIMVCGTSKGQPTVNGCSYPHRHVTAPMTQLDNTTTGGISISVETSNSLMLLPPILTSIQSLLLTHTHRSCLRLSSEPGPQPRHCICVKSSLAWC